MLKTDRGIIDNSLRESVTTNDMSKSVLKKSVSFASRQKFLSFVAQAEESPSRALMFRPNDSFKSKWDILIMVSACFNCFTIPFKVAFEPPLMNTFAFNILNTTIDFIFLADIFVTFRTSYIDTYGNEVSQPNHIAREYLSGTFWVDLAATLPLD